ncbi:hypothetical protein ACGFYA_13840 [Streptomyces sp. NPDC048305]|uniref:hypothetical protein n=1 Tax=Streptomyces sp. NPDC048305 TaxID=3365532 RepID=UPI003723CAF6
MYRTDATRPGAAPASPLRLVRAVHQVFPRGGIRIDDDFSARHFSDLTAAYGRSYRPGLVEGGTGNDFALMARQLVEGLGVPGEDVGAAVVAHATPDLDCRRAAATYLSDAWPHGPLAFGVGEQGGVTPFTALHLAGACARRNGMGHVLVLVLDQASLPYDPGTRLAGDAGVAMLLSTDDRPGPRPVVRVVPGVAAEEVPGELSRLLEPVLEAGPVTVVTGPGIDPPRDLPEGTSGVRPAAKGFPCSALWSALATADLQEERLVLIDRDPLTGDLGVCVTLPGPGES